MARAGFTQAEQQRLEQLCRAARRADGARAVWDVPDFIAACWRIRVKLERDRAGFSRSPNAEKKRYRTMRRAYEPGARGPTVRDRPEPSALDYARIAAFTDDPALRLHQEAPKSPRAARTLRQLENAKRPRVLKKQPELAAARRVALLFDKVGLPFKDYESRDHGRAGPAAIVLRVIVGGKGSVRTLIRQAQGKAR